MSFQRRNVLLGIAALPASSLLAGRPLPGLTATVYNGYELHTALQAAGAGSEIILAAGAYGDVGGVLRITQASVRLRAEPGAVLRESTLVIEGDDVLVDGLTIMPVGNVHLTAGEVIDRRTITGNGLEIRGVNAEVRNCDISRYSDRGIDVRASATGAYIHDNHIHDCLPGASVGCMIGTSTADTNKRVGARVVNNTCTNLAAGSTETLSFKSSGNLIGSNRLINCNHIENRHGEDNQIIGNRLERCLGIRIQDARTLVANNVLVSIRTGGRGFQIMGGSVRWDEEIQGKHPQAAYTVLRGNSGPMIIGHKYRQFTYRAINTKVESHSGTIKLGFQEGTILP
jgi:hypothetical protein